MIDKYVEIYLQYFGTNKDKTVTFSPLISTKVEENIFDSIELIKSTRKSNEKVKDAYNDYIEVFNIKEVNDNYITDSENYSLRTNYSSDKETSLKKLKLFFNKNIKSPIVFFTGYEFTDTEGIAYFCIQFQGKLEKLSYQDVYLLWNCNKKSTIEKDLVSIIDFCYCGGRLEDIIIYKQTNGTLQLGSSINEPNNIVSKRFPNKNFLMHYLNMLNIKILSKLIVIRIQNSFFNGNYIESKRKTRIMQEYWKDMLDSLIGKSHPKCEQYQSVQINYLLDETNNNYESKVNLYQGEWKNDLKEGKGILNYSNGDKYEGDWK